MKRTYRLVTTGVTIVLLLSSCANEQIEYITDDSNTSAVASQSSQGETDIVDQSTIAINTTEPTTVSEKFYDEFVVYDKFGKGYNIRMWLHPQRFEDEYSVYTYEDVNLTAQEKEKIVKMFAGGNTVYYYEEGKNRPKDAVQKEIDRVIERNEPESILKLLEGWLESAPELPVEATDYNENNFAYYEDEIPWIITFREHSLSLARDYNYEYDKKIGNVIAEEDAEKIIEDVLYNIGLTELKLISVSSGNNEIYGDYYRLNYLQGEEILEMGDGTKGTTWMKENYSDEYIKMWTCEYQYPSVVECNISQTGHLEYLSIAHLARLLDVKDNVTLLSEQDIIDIAINELKNNCDEYMRAEIGIEKGVSYNFMKLGYVIVSDEDKYYQIPCWEIQQRVQDSNEITAIYINAIDGSIVSNGKKTFEYVDASSTITNPEDLLIE